MYTYQQRLEYAHRLQQLQRAVVIKDNIHLTYKYKNRNKAYANVDSVQDRINKALIEDAVNGNGESIRKLEKHGEKLIHDTLTNERKRLYQDRKNKAVNHATKSNSQYYTNIFNYRRSKICENFEDKLEKELRKNKYLDLSDAEKINQLTNDFGDYGKKRLKNIITDAMHTNESNIGFIKAVEDGYNYKVWKNGRVAKGRTRAWHKEKIISAVPIDETFDIFGSYPAHMMYPGDLNGGAENVANCRCWLNYTNRIPSNLRRKTVFNVAPSFQQIWDNARKPAKDVSSKIQQPFKKLNESKSNGKISVIPFKPKLKSPIPKIKNQLHLEKENILNKLHENLSPQVQRDKNSKRMTTSNVEIIKDNQVKYYHLINVKDLLKKLPNELIKPVENIILHGFPFDDKNKIVGMVFHDSPTVVHIFKVNQNKEQYDATVIHEIAHVLDHNYFSKLYGISSSSEWVEAYKLDKQHNIQHKHKIKFNGFVSDYARDSYGKSVSYKYDNPYNGRFAEDFADSIKLYWTDKKFVEKFPNRARIIENIFYR